jgi:hypothetical protein
VLHNVIMITSSIHVASLNCQFRGTHKFLLVHHVCEETSLWASCGSQSCVHAPLQQVLVTVSPSRTNAHAHPSLRSQPSGHGDFNITSLTSGHCCLSSSTRSTATSPETQSRRLAVLKHTARRIAHACMFLSWYQGSGVIPCE